MKTTDLAYMAGKKRQSPRTGLVHGSDLFSDTVALYDNFCFAYALLSQRKAAEIIEAKTLLLRLLAFQAPIGNFPVSLHDFPHCYDLYQGLKIAPLLLRTLDGYGQVLGAECKEKIESSLTSILGFYENKGLPELWQFRYQVCLGNKPQIIRPSLVNIWEYWVSLQFLQTPTCDFYHQGLGIAPILSTLQNCFEPLPHLSEWACAAAAGTFSSRLLNDHPAQIQLAALEKVELTSTQTDFQLLITDPFKLYWNGDSLHSLCFVADKMEVTNESILVELPQTVEFGREDLFEVAFFCDASPETQIAIGGHRGTVFELGDAVEISTPSFQCTLRFELISGTGDFCGHIVRSNRPGQIACVGPLQHETFDWKIGLRTLRRSPNCTIRISFSLQGLTVDS